MEVLEWGFVLAKQVLSQLSYTPPATCMILMTSLIRFRDNDYLLSLQVLSQADLHTHYVHP